MNRALVLIVISSIAVACAKTPGMDGKAVLVVGFRAQVSPQEAEAVLEEIFDGAARAAYEPLFQDPRSLEAVRQKYPQRSLRAPAGAAIEKPLAYKVYVDLGREDIDRLIANKDRWEKVEYIQRDLQHNAYE